MSAVQTKVLTRRIGTAAPFDLDAYREDGGYRSLEKALATGPPAIVEQVKQSGLIGRGGAGFPTGLKWELTAAQQADLRYLICNADEGELGTHKDRFLLAGDPFRVLEGITIAAYAVGAAKALVYFNESFREVASQWEEAIPVAEEAGLLGEGILGSDFHLEVKIYLGRGLYVAGEEMVLIASLEGRRPTSRDKPPFPTQQGLFERPTCINNVETLANVPDIVERGPEWFRSMGTEDEPGTRVISLSGDVRREGVWEVEVGSCSLAEAIETFAGGTPDGKPIKAVQPGGGTSAFLPAASLGTPIARKTIEQAGSSLGTAGIIVYEEGRSMVDAAAECMDYYGHESCGRCTPCRVGSVRMLEIMRRLRAGEGRPGDLRRLRETGRACVAASICGMGQSFPLPVLSALRLWPEEFESRLLQAPSAAR